MLNEQVTPMDANGIVSFLIIRLKDTGTHQSRRSQTLTFNCPRRNIPVSDDVRKALDELKDEMRIPLKEYVKFMFEENSRAVVEARRLMEERMSDFPAQFVTKPEFGELLGDLSSKVTLLITFRDELKGKLSVTSIMAVVATILAVMSLVLQYKKF